MFLIASGTVPFRSPLLPGFFVFPENENSGNYSDFVPFLVIGFLFLRKN